MTDFSIEEVLDMFRSQLNKNVKGGRYSLPSCAQFQKMASQVWKDLDTSLVKKYEEEEKEKSSSKKSNSSSKKSKEVDSDDESEDEEESEGDDSDLDMSTEVEEALDWLMEEWDVYDNDIEGKITKDMLEKLVGKKTPNVKKILKVKLKANKKHLTVSYKDKNGKVKKELNVDDLDKKCKLIHTFMINDM